MVTKTVKVSIDLDTAKLMLGVAGFKDTNKMSESQVFKEVLDMMTAYGTKTEIID